jgi:hypothetical protein
MNYIATIFCQVCGHKLPSPKLNLGNHPLCDDLIPIEEIVVSEEYPINISLCENCLTANQLCNIKKEKLFPQKYHYRPRFTQDVISGMKELVDQADLCLNGLKNKVVCDIGCNDGTLLNFFKDKGCKTSGIEPTGAFLEAKKNHKNIIHDFFNIESANKLKSIVGSPDIITFTNVFAHIEDLEEAIAVLKSIIKEETLIIIENHYLGTVVKTNQFDTFYHEHPRTYSKKSFEFIAKKLGRKLLGVFFPKRYGGNIRIYLSSENFVINDPMNLNCLNSTNEDYISKDFEKMQSFIDNWKKNTRKSILDLAKEYGKVYGKSFPGRAAILLKLIDIDENIMPAIFEKKGSMKLNHFVPGTRIKIESDETWMNKNNPPKVLLIWAWHIHQEIADYLRSAGYKGKIYTPLPEFKEII